MYSGHINYGMCVPCDLDRSQCSEGGGIPGDSLI